MPTVTIHEMKDGSDFAICMAIRMEVFVREQGVPLDIEMDDQDEKATHYIARLDDAPAATARTRVVKGEGLIERVAVRREHRSNGVGKKLMQYLIQQLRSQPEVNIIHISAQTQARAFYEKLRFLAVGEEYREAGIPHIGMDLMALAAH